MQKLNSEKENASQKIKQSVGKPLFTLFCIGQALIIIIMIATMIIIDVSAQPLDIPPIEKWQSDYINYQNNSWYADSDSVPTDEEIDLVISPEAVIPRGSYTVKVDYECSSLQYCWAVSTNFISSSRIRLSPPKTSGTFNVDVSEDSADFKISVRYDGYGTLKINNIQVFENHCAVGRLLTYLLLIFAVCDIWYLFYDKIEKHKLTILALAAIVFFASMPLFNEGIGRGHDINFHAVRIEALVDSLRHGIFPNRVSTYWFDGYGYPTSIYYGDILLYVPALLRLIGFTVVSAYKAYVLMINIGTAVLGYFCFKGIFKSNNTALLSSLVYTTATYRLVNIYIRAAVGEYTAMMFLPVVALGFYKIYTGDMTKPKDYLRESLILTLGMTGLITCHMLSTEMVIFFLVIMSLVLIKRTVQLPTVRALAIAVGETVLLSAFYVVPFLDYYKNVEVSINKIIDEDIPYIGWQGCSLAEYFSVFRDVFTGVSIHNNHRLAATPGFVLMLAFVVGIGLIIYQKRSEKSRELGFYLLFSGLSLFVASDVFPWDRLAARTTLGRMLAQVQFPWRYVSLAIIFMTMVFAWLYTYLEKKEPKIPVQSSCVIMICAIAVIGFFTATMFTGAYLDDSSFRYWRDKGDVNTWGVSAGEYLLDGYSDYVNGQVLGVNTDQAEITEAESDRMVIYCESSRIGGAVEVPLFNYKGYTATDENGKYYRITNGANSTVRVELPPNFKGNIIIKYKEPWFWKAANVVSLLSLAAVIIFVIKMFGNAPKVTNKAAE